MRWYKEELHRMDNFYSDTHLNERLATLTDKGIRQGTSNHDGFRMTWTKEDFLDFTNWKEVSYSTNSLARKEKLLNSHGIILHGTDGRNERLTFDVTITNQAWYYLLLRGEYGRNNIAEAYIHELFNGNGYMELDRVKLSATLKEFAQKYAAQFSETQDAARNKIERIRKPLSKYGYLLKGSQSPTKQIRVKEQGADSWLQGPRAVMLDQRLRMEFYDFYQKLNVKVPYRKEDPLKIRLQTNKLRKDLKDDFAAQLRRKHKLDLIRSHYMSTLNDKAFTDYNAIISLYMRGATFTVIRSFLETRPAYWIDYEKQAKGLGKSIDEILTEIL